MLFLPFSLMVAILVLPHPASSWTKVQDERLAVELRVANEGLAHDDDHWYITNKHFIYKVKLTPDV